MASFHFDLVSPDRLLVSERVEQVDVPGQEGDFGVLAGHAPLVSTLRAGLVSVYRGHQVRRFVMSGGFAAINVQGLTILADAASQEE